MKKLAMYVMAISAGLIMSGGILSITLGLIYAVKYSPLWLLLVLCIVPAALLDRMLSRKIEKMHEEKR